MINFSNHPINEHLANGQFPNNRDTFFPDQLETVKILIDYGAAPTKNINGESPVDLINGYAGSREGFDKLMNLFRPAIPNIDKLITYQERKPTGSFYKK